MALFRVKVCCDASGNRTPHDGRYIVDWNPHTEAGVLALDSTSDSSQAKTWSSLEDLDCERWTVSQVEPTRPWDGLPNRPLRAIAIEVEELLQ